MSLCAGHAFRRLDQGDLWHGVRSGDVLEVYCRSQTGTCHCRAVRAVGMMILSAPVPCAWRAMTDNDHGNGMAKRLSVWRKPPILVSVLRRCATGGECILLRYSFAETQGGEADVACRFAKDGTCQVDVRLFESYSDRKSAAFFGKWKCPR